MLFPLLHSLIPQVKWKMPSTSKTLFLTFDDGPIPEVTPWVLKTLKDYNASATFFCVGANAKKNNEILKDILAAGHSIGNHTMNHINGWNSPNKKYYSDVSDCSKIVKSKLFRPPYGRIKFLQTLHLRKQYKIIMWDVLSRDYDTSLTGETCFENVKQSAGRGSIVVFHDSLKAESRLRIALPATLKYFSDAGYNFASINFFV